MAGLKGMHCAGWFAETGHKVGAAGLSFLCSAGKLNGCGVERAEHWVQPSTFIQSPVCSLSESPNALCVVVVVFSWLGCVFDSRVYNQVEQVYCLLHWVTNNKLMGQGGAWTQGRLTRHRWDEAELGKSEEETTKQSRKYKREALNHNRKYQTQ